MCMGAGVLGRGAGGARMRTALPAKKGTSEASKATGGKGVRGGRLGWRP